MKVSMRLQRSILRGIFAALATLACAPLAQAAGILPTGYVEVEYIQGNGSNTRIVTDYTPQPNIDKIEAVVEFPTLDTTQRAIWCARGAWNASTWTLFIINGNRFRFDYASNTGSSANIAVAASTKYTVTAASNQVVCASETQSGTHTYAKVDDFTCGGPLTLFYAYVDEPENNKGNWAKHRLYSFKVWRSDELIHYFIPCKDADGKATMVDICHNPATLTTEGTFAAGDEGHFFDDSSYTGSLYISSMPEHIGTPSPSGNVTDLALGATVEVSCGATPWTNATETAVYVCTGWKLYDINGNLDSSGAETSFTYTHPNPAEFRRLEWQWALSAVQGTVTAAAGGTVSPSGTAWYSGSAPVTVTATPDAGNAFYRWTGTLPDGIDETSASVTFTPTAPFNMTAVFATAFDYYVATDGDNANPGTEAEPFLTISNAIDRANAALATVFGAATIHVAPGAYDEFELVLTNRITIVGGGSATNAENCVLVQPAKLVGNDTRAFYLNHSEAVLENVKVRVGARNYLTNGRNVYLVDGTVRGCWIAGNGEAGDNLYMTGGLVEDTKISDGNRVNWENPSDGINIYATGGRIRRCVVTGGIGGNSVRLSGDTVMENSLITKTTNYRISGNQASYAYAVTLADTAKLVNCTLVDNTCYIQTTNGGGVTPAGGAVKANSANAQVVNCVLYGNDCDKSAQEWGNANATRFLNCAVPETAAEGLTNNAANGNIVIDEYDFEGFTADLYWPVNGSRLIDAGADLSAIGEFSATDLAGNARRSPASAPVDIGCYEADQDSLSCGFTVSAATALCGAGVTFTPTVYGAGSADVICRWDFDDGGSPVNATLEPHTYAFATAKAHTVTLYVSLDGGISWACSYTAPVPVLTAPADIWVDETNASGAAYPYATEATAATDLFAVLGMLTNAVSAGATVLDGVTVHVKPGTYTGVGYPAIGSAVKIVGVGSRDAVVFDAGQQGLPFYLKHEGATLSGLTVMNGMSKSNAPYGGNVSMEDGVVTNCVVKDGRTSANEYATGLNIRMSGGLVIDSVISGGAYTGSWRPCDGLNVSILAGRVSRCVISGARGNSTGNSSASVNMAGGVIENCLLTDNKTTSGAILLNGAAARAVNCTVVTNSSSGELWGYGIVCRNNSARVVNCAIYENGGTALAEWGNANAACFYNCAFSEAAAFTGANSTVTNLTDAAFKDYAKGNYHPVADGALFNAGDTVAYTNNGAVSTTDLDGAARIVKKVIDIGCYETATSAGLQIYVR